MAQRHIRPTPPQTKNKTDFPRTRYTNILSKLSHGQTGLSNAALDYDINDIRTRPRALRKGHPRIYKQNGSQGDLASILGPIRAACRDLSNGEDQIRDVAQYAFRNQYRSAVPPPPVSIFFRFRAKLRRNSTDDFDRIQADLNDFWHEFGQIRITRNDLHSRMPTSNVPQSLAAT